MKLSTDKAISALIATDETIKQADAVKALAILRGNGAWNPEAVDGVLSREEAAALLKVSKCTVSRWCREGILKRRRVKGRRKSFGYSKNSVLELLK